MKNILLKKTGIYSLISLFLFSPNLYAYCLDYIGLQQEAGLELENLDIIQERTLGEYGNIPTEVEGPRDVEGSSAALGYGLKYCARDGLTIDLSVRAILNDSTDSVDRKARYRSVTVDESGSRIKVFVGYRF